MFVVKVSFGHWLPRQKVVARAIFWLVMAFQSFMAACVWANGDEKTVVKLFAVLILLFSVEVYAFLRLYKISIEFVFNGKKTD